MSSRGITFVMSVVCFVVCFIAATLFVCGVSSAQEVAEQGTIASEKAELKELAKTPEVQEELEQPDGVSIEDLETDNWKILARGAGTYEFNDADDRKAATEEAVLEAKAALVKFMKERVATESQIDKLAEEETKKSKANGVTNVSVTKNGIKTTLSRIHNSAEDILSGILTLETIQKWDGNSGEVRVTLGQSEKSLAAAEKFKTRTGNSVTRADQAAGAADLRDGGPDRQPRGDERDAPRTIKKKSKTAF